MCVCVSEKVCVLGGGGGHHSRLVNSVVVDGNNLLFGLFFRYLPTIFCAV